MSIKQKLTAIVSVIITIIIAILTVEGYKFANENIEKRVLEDVSAKLKEEAIKMDAWIHEKKRLIENLADVLSDAPFDLDLHLQHMKYTQKAMDIYGVFSGYKNGEYADTSGWQPPNSEWTPIVRPWYTDTINEGKITTLGPMDYEANGQVIDFIAIGKALKKDGVPFGVVSSEIRLNELYDIISKIKFLTTGYLVLIKKDGTILVHPKKELAGKNLKDLGLNGLYNTISSNEKGLTSFAYKGTDKVVAYKHLKELPWVLFSIVEQKEIDEPSNEVLYTFIIIGVISLIFSLVILYFAITVSLKPLGEMREHAIELASGDGDLTKLLKIDRKDEIANASKEINIFITKVRDTIHSVKEIANENSSVSHELSSSSLEVGNRVESATALVSETTEISQQIKEDIDVSIDEANKAKEEIVNANKVLNEAQSAILDMTRKVDTSATLETELASRIEQLSQDAEQVKEVLTVINDIADQTNLLALNAAIEAARAGEHGRGFAVVADEVRQLAERTQRSLTEINATINVIVQAISDSSGQMNDNSHEIQNLSNLAQQVESKIIETTKVMTNATKTNEKMIENYLTTGKQIDDITTKIKDANRLTSENARSVEEISSAAEHLNTMTENLTTSLNQFRT